MLNWTSSRRGYERFQCKFKENHHHQINDLLKYKLFENKTHIECIQIIKNMLKRENDLRLLDTTQQKYKTLNANFSYCNDSFLGLIEITEDLQRQVSRCSLLFSICLTCYFVMF